MKLFNLLLDSFNSKVKNVIDDIALARVSKKNGRQKSPWRKSTAVQSIKRQCRKAERMWRKTKLEIHYSIYKDSLHPFNVELATARSIQNAAARILTRTRKSEHITPRPYTGFQLHLGLILKYFYSFINLSMA